MCECETGPMGEIRITVPARSAARALTGRSWDPGSNRLVRLEVRSIIAGESARWNGGRGKLHGEGHPRRSRTSRRRPTTWAADGILVAVEEETESPEDRAGGRPDRFSAGEAACASGIRTPPASGPPGRVRAPRGDRVDL